MLLWLFLLIVACLVLIVSWLFWLLLLWYFLLAIASHTIVTIELLSLHSILVEFVYAKCSSLLHKTILGEFPDVIILGLM